MSASPDSTETQEPERDYTYTNTIPKLGPARTNDKFPSLLPLYGGKPGYTYLQCPIVRQREAQDNAKWKWQPVRDTKIYTIRGPLGQVDCVLLCSGKPIPGTDHRSNKRVVYLDPDISEITGLSGDTGLIPEEPEESINEKQERIKAAGFGQLNPMTEGTPISDEELSVKPPKEKKK